MPSSGCRCLATSALMGKMRTAMRMSSKSRSTITSGPSSKLSCFSSGEGRQGTGL
ncbi:calcium channel, voltage-dependent, P/Q type, alpha 1A subunit, isoform CRA_e [Rattus norvegicus]|uniref:Calcium channel, voltage-dependent, P/Q type, alpha 1A subunit, isoform CRA_e n=1 Tax=Rattus norvegicus TaxID=10116 RepID=A6IY95_RAT|nr:calcium channel, voltage-dependent, P/Q type, alpha 1A subunit, isoform CRA_e [Rattus norvegicus]